jgi:hypothetical protein
MIVEMLSIFKTLIPNNMAKSNRNSGKQWTATEVAQLRKLAKQNTPTRVIGIKLGRPVGGIYNKAAQNKISLKPTNQSPYNRRKK